MIVGGAGGAPHTQSELCRAKDPFAAAQAGRRR